MPPYPSIFIKPSRTVAGWDENISIPVIAQKNQLDYEGELVSSQVICYNGNNKTFTPIIGYNYRKGGKEHIT